MNFDEIKKVYEELITEEMIIWLGKRKFYEIDLLMKQGLTREEAWGIAKDLKVNL